MSHFHSTQTWPNDKNIIIKSAKKEKFNLQKYG